ncbi:formylmethanofuran dehydrogenase subunit E family protein [Desulfosporosinus youngiae]|uniref:Formylmethanofuran dehydrogenase subunit E n=1 Tax=Desulfosporosinus youngiae DSM 17734 TaxID=768710 RepID=H5XVL8_9FIRM|nr:formylmethanofuran dehydrogenase subunit E family protein [Desulfosporosinus youngiae]EHQ90101.1 formylmethanofuran dehydrogenase subunit E [Desulfosporosinus youngiae DSM 17734]
MCIEKTPWEQVIDFHGHTCPGIALGYRVAQIAKRELGFSPEPETSIMITAYTHSCALDAFQIINRATYGRGNLRVEETKQHVYHFQKTGGLEELQISIRPEILEHLSVTDQSLTRREQQNKNLEAIKVILGAEESLFCSFQFVKKQ